MRRRLVVQVVPPDVVVVLCGLLPRLTSLQPGSVIVVIVIMMSPVVGASICLVFMMLVAMVLAVTVAVLVSVRVVMIGGVMETFIVVAALVAGLAWEGFLRIQRGLFTLWCSAVLPHLVNKEDFGHVVDDEHLSPVRDWLGLSTTEMNVHDEDCEGGGGCDHSHGGNVVFP